MSRCETFSACPTIAGREESRSCLSAQPLSNRVSKAQKDRDAGIDLTRKR